MTVTSSLDLTQKIKSCKSKICRECGLYLNQLPAVEKAVKSHIFWVGLSAVQFNDDTELLPLPPNTRSGALIESVEEPLKNEISFYKTNLVKCLPLKGDGKIRYPLEHEMEKCFPNFEYELDELNPSVVFLLGRQVAAFVMKKLGFSEISLSEEFKYESFEFGNTTFVPVHHPSYILVYKRRSLDSYIKSLQSHCRVLTYACAD